MSCDVGKTHRRSYSPEAFNSVLMDHGLSPMDLFSGAEERQKVLLIMGLRFWNVLDKNSKLPSFIRIPC